MGFMKEGDKVPYLELANWMSQLDDDVPMSALSIPGTHDSAAYTTTWPFVSTQNLSIKQQLHAGIRYYDLRCGLVNDTLQMVHGSATLGITLEDVFSAIYTFLASHASEAVIVQIKEDRKREKSERVFADVVLDALRTNARYWRVMGDNCRLGELRGRIQLFRRFTGNRLYHFGVNVTRWQDNPTEPFWIYTEDRVRLVIQDHYNFSNPEPLPSAITKKGEDVGSLLSRAVADHDPFRWYINFTSAFEFNVYYQLNPRQIALGGYWVFRWVEGINLRLYATLKTTPKGKRRYGIVVMDFPELPALDLVKCIVESNFPEPPPPVRRNMATIVLVLILLLLIMPMLLWQCGSSKLCTRTTIAWSFNMLRHIVPTWAGLPSMCYDSTA